LKHNLLEELIKFKFEKFNGIGHQNFRGCGNTWRQGHISRRVCTQEGTYQNRCGTSHVIIKSRNLQVSGFPGFLQFVKIADIMRIFYGKFR